MLAAFIITLREGLEAALIVGIILAFLLKTGGRDRFKQVYFGLIVAIGMSVVFALIFQWIAGGFTGQSEQIFGGVTTLIAAALLTTMIIWMNHHASSIKEDLEQRAESAISSPSWGIFFLIFVSVLREGVETVIFIFGIPVNETTTWIGASLGFLAAIIIAVVYFYGSKRIRIQTFFRITTVLLVIFAAGMVAYGVHELQEAAVLPTYIEHVWDINFILDENGLLGQILKGLIGYNGNPSLLEVIAYVLYLGIMITYFYLRRKRQTETVPIERV